MVGTVAGAIKGPSTETGLVRGACVGAITGAITALQLMDMIVNGEPFSKVRLVLCFSKCIVKAFHLIDYTDRICCYICRFRFFVVLLTGKCFKIGLLLQCSKHISGK